MKQVTIDTVRERIAELDCLLCDGVLSLRGEFELACLRQLLALQERVTELEENDREQMAELYRRNATIQRLQQQAAPVVPDEMTPEMMRAVQLNSELGAYAVSNLSGAYDLFSEFWKVARSAAMLQGAEHEPDADNTAQQFESLAYSKAHDCLWSYDSQEYSWSGKCGTSWTFFDDGPEENGVKFCHGCGKPVSTTSAGSGKP